MKVYAVCTGGMGGSPRAYAATIERAKQDAEDRLASYWESAKEAPDLWEDASLVETLEWEYKIYDWNGPVQSTEYRWQAMMDDIYAFSIEEIEVLE